MLQVLVTVILHNWAKNIPNMGVAAPQAPVGGWGSGPLKSPNLKCISITINS